MIIARKYETYWDLCRRDEEAKKIIFEYLGDGYATREEHLGDIGGVIIENTMIEHCVLGYREMYERLVQLDKTKPYDNGLSFEDVNYVYPSVHEDEITLLLYSHNPDCFTRIVKVVTICENGGKDEIVPTRGITDVEF